MNEQSQTHASPLVVAIDGPSGSGKSSVSKAVARELNLAYLDTGAMYRAATLWCLVSQIDLADGDLVADTINELPVSVPTDPDDQRWFLRIPDAEGNLRLANITDEIREQYVTRDVSRVATNLGARAHLVRWQQQMVRDHEGAANAPGGTMGIVVEGRDITTVIAPHAPVRLLLTASPAARLRRRSLENTGTADSAAIDATADEIIRRDADDSTVADFMTAAPGVTVIDSTELNLAETVEAVISAIDQVRDWGAS